MLLIHPQSNLEFMLRFQQYVELVRTQDQSKLLESITHAKKYLTPFKDSYPREVQQACGLLAFPPGTQAKQYNVGHNITFQDHAKGPPAGALQSSPLDHHS